MGWESKLMSVSFNDRCGLVVGLIFYKSGRKIFKCGRNSTKTDELFLIWVEIARKSGLINVKSGRISAK